MVFKLEISVEKIFFGIIQLFIFVILLRNFFISPDSVPSVIGFLCIIFVTVCIFVINFAGGKYHMSVGEIRVGKTRKKERKNGVRVADESIR